jgi:hypothetical protein
LASWNVSWHRLAPSLKHLLANATGNLAAVKVTI